MVIRVVFFFKQKTAYEMRISDWSSDVCSSDLVADTPDELKATPEQIDAHKRLVAQAVKTFGSQHYDNYHFLFTISDNLGGIGLEHHRSSEDGADVGYFTDWKNQVPARNLLPHEYTHSWDGRTEEHTSELPTLMRNSYAVFWLKKTTQ